MPSQPQRAFPIPPRSSILSKHFSHRDAFFPTEAFRDGRAINSERVPVLSCGIKLYVLLLPVFYVEVVLSAAHHPSSSSLLAAATSSLTELRIATAGVWHNLVLALVVSVLAAGREGEESGALSGGGLGFGTRIGEALRLWKRMEEGVLVTAVDEVSLKTWGQFNGCPLGESDPVIAFLLHESGLGPQATSPAWLSRHSP